MTRRRTPTRADRPPVCDWNGCDREDRLRLIIRHRYCPNHQADALAGIARMARARQHAGQPLTDFDLEAIARTELNR